MAPEDVRRGSGGAEVAAASPSVSFSFDNGGGGGGSRQRHHHSSLSAASHKNGGAKSINNNNGGGKRAMSVPAMSEGGAGVIGQIGQMYGALQEEMQSLESEYSRLKIHLHEDYTKYYHALEGALAESEQKLKRARAKTRELRTASQAERETMVGLYKLNPV
jgi:hypothetical protein